jgi:hypothetical protein
MPTARWGAAAAVWSGWFYVIGGLGGDGCANEHYARAELMSNPVVAPCLPSRSRAEGRVQNKGPEISLRASLPLLGSNQDSPDPESSRPGRHFGQPVGKRPLSEHRCPLPALVCPLLPGETPAKLQQ